MNAARVPGPPLTPEAQALLAAGARWQAEGRPAAVVTVTAHRGSVPRETGTRMLVSAEGCVGTIGGGRLEQDAIERALQLLAAGVGAVVPRPSCAADASDAGDGGDETVAPVTLRVALGPALGQCCGGAVELRIALLAQDPPAGWDWPAPRLRLQLYGAGHVGRAIVRLLATLPCHVRWIDGREDGFPDEPLPPHIVTEALADPADLAEAAGAVAEAAPGDWHLVLTHSHALDLAIVDAVLARRDAGWLGLIGSRSKRASFEHRLRERGHDEAALARLVCPIGLPGLVGKQPEVIALAVVAQLWQQLTAAGVQGGPRGYRGHDGNGVRGALDVQPGRAGQGRQGVPGAPGFAAVKAAATLGNAGPVASGAAPGERGLELPPGISISS
jgi:xanthine dehydrogenase accessory factor